MHGDKIIADRSSFLGNIGYRTTPWMVKRAVEKSEVDVRYVHHGENKVRFNKLKELRDQDVEWLLNIQNKRVSHILDYTFEKRELTDECKDILKDGKFMYGKEAEKNGLIDKAA